MAGHVMFAEYLKVPYVAGAGELAVFCGCMMGSALGFLWYNCHPARVFMGDTGSLALGGAIGMVTGGVALAARKGQQLHRAVGKVFFMAMFIRSTIKDWQRERDEKRNMGKQSGEPIK